MKKRNPTKAQLRRDNTRLQQAALQETPDTNEPLRSGRLFDAAIIAGKLANAHRTITQFMGDKWPSRAAEIKELLHKIAAEEKKSEMTVAVERAKQCSPIAGLQILAAAYEMAASSNTRDDRRRSTDSAQPNGA